MAGKKLWPEHEIINEEESEYDDEISDDTCNANSLVSSSRVDESMQSLLERFEVSFPHRLKLRRDLKILSVMKLFTWLLLHLDVV